MSAFEKNSFPAFAPDAGDLPYRVNLRGWELAAVIAGYGLAGAALLIAGVMPMLGHGFATNGSIFSAVAIAAAVGCAYRLWRLKDPFLILYPDRLERRELMGWRTLNRSDIKGVQDAGADRFGAWFAVVPTDERQRGARLRKKLRDDPKVDRWFQGARDLTAEARATEQAAIVADPRYGVTEAERAARLALAKRVAVGFNIVCLMAAAWLYFFAEPGPVALAVSVATLAAGGLLVWASKGLMVWVDGKGVRPRVLAAVAPAAAAAFQAWGTVHLLNWEPVAVAAGVAGVAVGVLMFMRRTALAAPGPIFAFAVMASLLTYGLIMLCNAALDTSTPKLFPLLVLNKHYSSGRSTTYYFDHDAWSDQPAGAVSVPSRLYSRVAVGEAVCFRRMGGAFGVPWFAVVDCPSGTPLPAPPLSSFYPTAAMAAGKEGAARIDCAVVNGARLTDCHIESESPPGLGFGEAAVQAAAHGSLGIPPSRLRGRSRITIPMQFKIPN